MPSTATPVVKPAALRVGDILPSGVPVTERPSLMSKGPRKGHVRVETETGALVLEPDGGFHVQREVPTAEERTAYLEASRTFHNVAQVVDARGDVIRAEKELRSVLDYLVKNGPLYVGRRSLVLRHHPAALEAAVARFVALYEAHYSSLKALDVTPEKVDQWGAEHLDSDLYSLSPRYPLNADCHLDGTPAVHPNGSTRYTVAPLEA